MPVVCEHSPQSPPDDDLIPAPLLQQAQAYLVARALHIPAPSQSDKAWLHFYSTCNNYIRRTARACGTPPADLDDCAQQVWLDLLISLPRFAYDPCRSGFRAWIATLVHSKSIDLIRQRARHPPHNISRHMRLCASDPRDAPPEACQRAEQLRLIGLLLLSLKRSTSSRNFRIFFRRCILGPRTAQVAAKLALTPNQIRFRLHRIRERISQMIAPDGPGLKTRGIPEILEAFANSLDPAQHRSEQSGHIGWPEADSTP